MSKTKKKKNKIIETLGSVDNLESYVKADWWRHLFNANYLRTDGDVVDDVSITEKEIDLFISILKVSKNSKLLDLCCGQGRHCLEFAKRGFNNIFGFDRSHYLINRAKKIKKDNELNVTFKEGDARKISFSNDSFNIVMIAGNSFGYFESVEDDERILKEVLRVLKPEGKLLLEITDGFYIKKHFHPRSWEWIDKNYFVCRERSLTKDEKRLISREVITHTKKGVVADQFYAERLYSSTEIKDLLLKVGFKEIYNHSDVFSSSKRNQDLGMMAKRMIITSVAKKKKTYIIETRGKIKKVAVLMGDPRKKDVVKPTSSFDEDDYHTIDNLKASLSSLPHYNFVYFNKHDDLIKDLQKIKRNYDYVFNLCDEGFNNEASKELHIAALLEMVDIHYSGGTPQCLSYCYDKSLVRGIAKEMGIPVPKAFMIKPDDIQFINFELSFPVLVKPNFGDSSFGITKESVCSDIDSLKNAIISVRAKFGYKDPILIEEFLNGKDISVGILGNLNSSYKILPIIEEDYSALPDNLPRICGYEAKWDPKSPYWKITSIMADLPEDVSRFLGASCLDLFNRLECRDYARFDWRLDKNGTPRLLEANPNPGWCWDGHLAKMASLEGISYSEMLGQILSFCEERR